MNVYPNKCLTANLSCVDKAFPNTSHYRDPHDIAKTLVPEQPVQCFSKVALHQQIRLFTDHFPGDVTYAVKANPGPEIIKAAYHSGIKTFDVASPDEMAQISAVAPDAKLHYHNPIRSKQEIETAWRRYGCRRFSVDDPREFAKLNTIVDRPHDVEVSVRFKLPFSGHAVHDFSEKFGMTPLAAAQLLADVKRHGYTPVLTFHPGSQCLDPDSWQQHINVAANIAHTAGVRVATLNVGGGFPIDYGRDRSVELTDFFDKIQAATTAAFGVGNEPRLECEPGRAIVATCLSVLTRVKLVRQSSDEIFLNDGIYGNLMEAYQAPDLQPQATCLRCNGTHGRKPKPFVVYGPTCDPLDRLPEPILLPADIDEDDYIIFRHLGAYSSATSTNFNGYGHSRLLYVDRP